MKYCKNYCGVECINGACPLALAEEYPWEEYPDFKSCDECPYNWGVAHVLIQIASIELNLQRDKGKEGVGISHVLFSVNRN